MLGADTEAVVSISKPNICAPSAHIGRSAKYIIIFCYIHNYFLGVFIYCHVCYKISRRHLDRSGLTELNFFRKSGSNAQVYEAYRPPQPAEQVQQSYAFHDRRARNPRGLLSRRRRLFRPVGSLLGNHSAMCLWPGLCTGKSRQGVPTRRNTKRGFR